MFEIAIYCFLVILLLVCIKKQRGSLTGFIFASYLGLQVVMSGFYFAIVDSMVYRNPILGEVDLEFSYRLLAITVICLLILYFICLRVWYYNSYFDPKDYAALIEKNWLLKGVALTIWPIYILDIYFGHFFLSPMISFLVNICGPLSFFVAYFERRKRKLFFALLLFASPFAVASGSRGPLFFPISLFIIGKIFNQSIKLKSVILGFTSGAIIVFVSSVLALARYSVRYSDATPFLDQLSVIVDVSSDLIIASEYGLVFISLFAERVVQWPVFVGLQIVSEAGGNLYPHSWFDEFIFSLSLSGFMVDSVNIQERILESGMLYGGVKFLGYDPSVGWTVPLNLFSESVMRGGIFQLFIVVFCFLIAIETLNKSHSTLVRYYFAVLPGYILIRFAETHSVYLVKDFFYFFVFLYIVKSIHGRRVDYSNRVSVRPVAEVN